MLEAPESFVGDDQDDHDERDGIGQRRQDAGAMVAVGVAGVGRPLVIAGAGSPRQVGPPHPVRGDAPAAVCHTLPPLPPTPPW